MKLRTDRVPQPIRRPHLQNGWLHARESIEPLAIAAASLWALERYLFEHFDFIGAGQVKGFDLSNPFPSNRKDEILKLRAQLSAMDFPTLYGSISLQARLRDQFLSLSRQIRLLETLSTILDSEEVYLHLAPAVRVIHPSMTSAAVPPHNDHSYNTQFKYANGGVSKVGPLFLTVWIPLKGQIGREGGLGVYPGIFSSDKVVKDTDDFWIAPPREMMEALASSPCLEIDYELGDAVIFVPELWHQSVLNRTQDSFRISCDMRVFGRNTKTSRHYMDCRTGERFAPGTGPAGFSE